MELIASVTINVLDAAAYADSWRRSGLFGIVQDLPGTGGAHLIRLRPAAIVAPLELVIEQPHVSRRGEWKITTGLQIGLPCKDIEDLEVVYAMLSKNGCTVTEWCDRPWGAQFWLDDMNGNRFMFVNGGG